jgi:hypothetical protein
MLCLLSPCKNGVLFIYLGPMFWEYSPCVCRFIYIFISIYVFGHVLHVLEINLCTCTPCFWDASRTRPERVPKCVPFAFHSRSIRVPFAFQLRSICVPFAFRCYRNASAERVPITLVSKPDIVGNHRDFPSISQPHLHILCSHYKAWNRVFIFAFH